MMTDKNQQDVKSFLLNLQDTICNGIEQLEPTVAFKTDKWKHANGGGGITRVIGGEVIEKGGVNFSHVKGDALPAAASEKRPELAGKPFEAMGVSLVIHPVNPFVPTSHANVRFFVADPQGDKPFWWFGGGYDLTPYYAFEQDVIAWHQEAKVACDPFGEDYYLHFKKWCDEYFYLPHRDEQRGVGGLFFDDFNDKNFDHAFGLMKSIGESYLKAYLPIVNKRKDCQFDETHRAFQAYRRGRYVEYNLLYDRGTIFGLQSKGRTESILMSLPPKVEWHYQYQTKPGSEEAKLTDYYLKPRDWLA